MAIFNIENIGEAQLTEAWPVVQMSRAYPSFAWWKADAEEVLCCGGGVLGARAPDGCIHGVATYKPMESPGGDRLLSVEQLITFELGRASPCRRALSEALDLLTTLLAYKGVALLPGRGRTNRIFGTSLIADG